MKYKTVKLITKVADFIIIIAVSVDTVLLVKGLLKYGFHLYSFYINLSTILFFISLLFLLKNKRNIIIAGFYIFAISYVGHVLDLIQINNLGMYIGLFFTVYLTILYMQELTSVQVKPILKLLYWVKKKNYKYAFQLSLIEQKNGDYDKAKNYIEIAHENGLTTYEYNKRYGLILFDEKRYNECIFFIDNAIKENDDDLMLNYYIGYSYSEIGNYATSIYYLTKFLEKENDIDVRYVRAVSYSMNGDILKSIEDYTRMIEENKNRADIYYNRGLEYQKINMMDEAIKDWENATIVESPDPKAFIALAKIEHENDNIEKAKQLFCKGISLDSSLTIYVPLEYRN